MPASAPTTTSKNPKAPPNGASTSPSRFCFPSRVNPSGSSKRIDPNPHAKTSGEKRMMISIRGATRTRTQAFRPGCSASCFSPARWPGAPTLCRLGTTSPLQRRRSPPSLSGSQIPMHRTLFQPPNASRHSTTTARSGPSSRCIFSSSSPLTVSRRSRRSILNGRTRSRSPRCSRAT